MPQLPVGPHAERCRALGDLVSQTVPVLDQLVELTMNRQELRALNRLVKLLPDKRQSEQLGERGLQLHAGLVSEVRAVQSGH